MSHNKQDSGRASGSHWSEISCNNNAKVYDSTRRATEHGGGENMHHSMVQGACFEGTFGGI